MQIALFLAVLSTCAGLATTVSVAVQREKRDLHWLLLGLLGGVVVWTSGTILRWSVASPEGLGAAMRLIFIGVVSVPPLWFALAARYGDASGWLVRREVWAALAVPSVLTYLALLTNDAHHLVMTELSFEVLARGGLAWGGPLFWVFITWAYALVLGGAVLYLRAARQMVAGADWRRGVTLAVASVIPIAVSTLYLFRLVPVHFDLTPASLIVSTLLISLAIFRYRLLESLPLARRDVIEHLRDGVVMANAAGVILDLNPAAAASLGRAAGQLRGRPLAEVLGEFVDPQRSAEVRAWIELRAADAPPLVLETRTDDNRSVEVSAAWACDSRGYAVGRFAVLRDRTEERRYERAVRHAQRLQSVGTLAAGIAHEVNNPLAFIRANLSQIHQMGEWVEAGAGGCEEVPKLLVQLADLRQIAEETLDGIGRIERIVTGMRRLAATQSEAFQAVDLNQVVNDALRLSNLGREPEIAVQASLAGSLPTIDGAPERLVQAVLNLLVNARQALRGCGLVCVETWSEGDRVGVCVTDDGPGIPPEVQERIFDPFFTTKDPDQGTGLGLAIAFDIVRDHGGVLEVSSSPGAGACFAARLPVR